MFIYERWVVGRERVLMGSRGVAAGGSARMRALLLLHAAGAGGSTLRHLSSYDYDPAAQRGWLTLGKTDNLTLLAEGWARYRLPALFELGQNDPSSSLLCFTNGSKPMIPCGGHDAGSLPFYCRGVGLFPCRGVGLFPNT